MAIFSIILHEFAAVKSGIAQRHDGGRLGRHVHHDDRSFAFPAPMAAHLKTITHTRTVPIFDQGPLGSCTGNACAGMLETEPVSSGPGMAGKPGLTEADAVSIYSDASQIDPGPPAYPPNDTGSSGLAVMKVAQSRGLIKGYAHAFGIKHALQALMLSPGITGISWRTGCDSPDANGVVRYRGAIRGGHEIELLGYDDAASLVWFANSWGTGWGKDGYFAMSVADYGRALADNGDVTFPTS